jgi:hypothetical protein
MYEAQQAHYFSLPANIALTAVTSTPAAAAGMSHRIGIIREGSDADVVIWDSHPLQLGATPVKVWIDGILQIPTPPKTGNETQVEVGKGKDGDEWRRVPDVPKWDEERKKAILWDGLPPLQGKAEGNRIVFDDVKKLLTRGTDGSIREAILPKGANGTSVIVVESGKITCIGPSCLSAEDVLNTINLHGGTISPGLMSFGSLLGLEEIAEEPSTGDGAPLNAFMTNIPKVLDDPGGVLKAMDALVFGTRNAL